MTLNYATLTCEYTGGLFGTNVFVLKFLNKSENESYKINDGKTLETFDDGKTFETFDDGVVFLGSIGYKLCSVITLVNSTHVGKGWFLKEVHT